MAVIIEDGFTGIAQDLLHPRVGWHKEPGTIAADNAADGFAAANAFTPLTYTAWKPSSAPSSLEITFDAAASPSYLGIAAHTIADAGATVTVRKLIGATWSDWGDGTTATPTNNDPILFLLDPQEVDGIGIEVTGGTPIIGVVRAGDVMEWPRKATWTGLPISESARLQYAFNESDKGNWLGRSLRSRGQEFEVQIDNVSETYRRTTFRDFAAHANTGDATFWITPRPYLTRRPNLLDWSEDLSNGVYTTTGTARAAPVSTGGTDLGLDWWEDTLGSATADRFYQSAGSVEVGEVFTFSFYVDATASTIVSSGGTLDLYVGESGSQRANLRINLDDFSVINPGTGGNSILEKIDSDREDLGGGKYRYWVTGRALTEEGADSLWVGGLWGLDTTSTSDKLVITGFQVERGLLSAYQKTEDGTEFFSDEVAYAWSPEVVRMSREIPNRTVSGSVSLNLQGHLPV